MGPLVAGILAQYTAAPLKTPFYVYLPLVGVIGVLVTFTRETVEHRETGALTLQRVGVPKAIRSRFIAPAIAAFGSYALVGYYAALIPSILKERLQQPGPLVGGAIVFELAFLSGAVPIITRNVPSRAGMLVALATLIPSIALLLFAQSWGSMPTIIIAAASGSVCWGLGIRNSLQVINDIAPDARRAEVIASYYMVGFVGNSIPVIGIGVIAALSDEMLASLVFGCTIAAFAVGALVIELLRLSPRHHR